MVSRTSRAGSASWSCTASQYSSVSDEPSCHVRRTTSARSAGYEWAMGSTEAAVTGRTGSGDRRDRSADTSELLRDELVRIVGLAVAVRLLALRQLDLVARHLLVRDPAQEMRDDVQA